MNKKLSLSALVIMGMAFTSCLAPMQGGTTTQTQQTQQQSAQAGGLDGILGNILAGVLGSITTTQANLVGRWTYTEPSVQFESDNLLTQAGGAAAAAKVESQLVGVYQKVGITPGKLIFTFGKDGQMTYQIGSKSLNGSYVFDASNKVVKITTATGMSLNAYVTISGQYMSLCFDSSKLLSIISGASAQSNNNILGNIGTIAQSFTGMKTGFKFTR